MQQQRQNQQRNLAVGSQNGEAHSSMPVGTKLQGHVETVKDKFGFIRYDNFHSGHKQRVQALIMGDVQFFQQCMPIIVGTCDLLYSVHSPTDLYLCSSQGAHSS